MSVRGINKMNNFDTVYFRKHELNPPAPFSSKLKKGEKKNSPSLRSREGWG
jgi:hypothetical protein